MNDDTLHYAPAGTTTACNKPITTVNWTPTPRYAVRSAHPCEVCKPIAEKDAARVFAMTARQLLDAARQASPDRPEGTARQPHPGGTVLVTWDRVNQRYDVGTEARSIVKGRRSIVLPTLEKLVAGESVA